MERLTTFRLKIITCIVTTSQIHHDPFLLIKKTMALLSVTAQLRLFQELCTLRTGAKLMVMLTHTGGLELTSLVLD